MKLFRCIKYLYNKRNYMYKNFNLTESEREEILNRHKEHGYKQPLNEQKSDRMVRDTMYYGTSTKDSQRYQLNVAAANSMGGSVDVFNPQGQKISDGLFMSVLANGNWGWSNLPQMTQKYGEFKNVKQMTGSLNEQAGISSVVNKMLQQNNSPLKVLVGSKISVYKDSQQSTTP